LKNAELRQPASRYAERSARHPAGAPGSEQFSPACHEIVRGCRCEYRHPTHIYHKEKYRNFDASKEVGLQVNAQKTKHVLLFHHQNAGQNCDIKIANKSFENVATTVTNQNFILEEIKRSNSGKAYYHSAQKLLFSCLLSRKIISNSPLQLWN
jgi:hypothetical protein